MSDYKYNIGDVIIYTDTYGIEYKSEIIDRNKETLDNTPQYKVDDGHWVSQDLVEEKVN